MKPTLVPTRIPSTCIVFAKASDSSHPSSRRLIVQGIVAAVAARLRWPALVRLSHVARHPLSAGKPVECLGPTVSVAAHPQNLPVSTTVSTARFHGLCSSPGKAIPRSANPAWRTCALPTSLRRQGAERFIHPQGSAPNAPALRSDGDRLTRTKRPQASSQRKIGDEYRRIWAWVLGSQLLRTIQENECQY